MHMVLSHCQPLGLGHEGPLVQESPSIRLRQLWTAVASLLRIIEDSLGFISPNTAFHPGERECL